MLPTLNKTKRAKKTCFFNQTIIKYKCYNKILKNENINLYIFSKKTIWRKKHENSTRCNGWR